MVATLSLYRTTIGKKAVMAVTGLIGYGYVVAHMLGNLKVFEGAEAMNAYAHHLRTIGEPIFGYGQLLMIVRVVLLVAVVAHVTAAVQLTRQDRAGRPAGYAGGRRTVQASLASRTMRWGGLALFLYIVFHLLQLTTGNLLAGFVPDDAYGNVVRAFSSPLNVAIYVAAMVCLALHLYHGVWSAFQSLGLNDRRTDRAFRLLAMASALLLFVGFSIVPVAVLTGIVPPAA
jgi:succinate dehydrogenase / fumarate reductase cytochrome b subunit